MIKVFKLWFLGAIGVVVVACVATPGAENTAEYLDSTAVTNTVKTKLVNKLGAQGLLIRVKTYRDEVQLQGVVHDATTQHQAGLIAASVENVKHVRNDIIVN